MYAKARSVKEDSVKAKNKAQNSNKYRGFQSSKSNKIAGGSIGESEVLRDPEDIRLDRKYEGQTQVLLRYVPNKAIDERTELEELALREWIIYGIVEEDPYAQTFFDETQKLTEIIEDIEKKIKKIPKLNFYDEHGNPQPENISRQEREKLFTKYNEERVAAEGKMDQIDRELKAHIAWRKSMHVELNKLEIDKNTDTSIWTMKLGGTDDVEEMEDLLIQKRNWSGVKLAVGKLRNNPPIPHWAGRGVVPDGSNPTLPDYSQTQMNMLGVRLTRVPAGLGFYRELDRNSTTYAGDQFKLYYGEYEQGYRNGYGISIDDSGVYVGGFEKGFRRNRGRLDLSDGTTIMGQFGISTVSSLPEINEFPNPYLNGEPNGDVEIHFSDGGYFKGQIKNGRISGQGDYQSAFNEMISGYFADGILHGDNGFWQTSNEEVYMGSFKDGELHGYGSFLSPNGDQYEGFWDQNLRHGRGIYKYADAGCYRGYFLNNLKHGKGSLEFGQLLTKPPKSKKQSESNSSGKDNSPSNKGFLKEDEIEVEHDFSPFEYIYQGYFLGNEIANLGNFMHTRRQTPMILSKADRRKVFPIKSVLTREIRLKKQSDRVNEKNKDMEQFIRQEIVKKKLKIYKQQKHFTKKMIYEDDVYNKFDSTQLKAKHFIREERLKKAKKDQDENCLKRALVPRLRQLNDNIFKNYSDVFERLHINNDDLPITDQINEKLVQIALSDFEEVRERQRFLKYDLIWQRAENAFIDARKSAAIA